MPKDPFTDQDAANLGSEFIGTNDLYRATTGVIEKQGWVSIWLGNEEDSIGEYVDLTYDEDGESVPS